MTIKDKVLVAAAFVAPLIIIGMVIYTKHTAHLRPSIAALVTKQRSSDTLRKEWAGDNFIPLTDENIERFAAEVKIDSKVTLGESEIAGLRDTVERFLKAYRSDNFEEIIAFRFPITNGVFVASYLDDDKSGISKYGDQLLKSNGLTADSLNSMSPLEVWRLKLPLPILQQKVHKWIAVGRSNSVVVVNQSEHLPDISNVGDLLTYYKEPTVETWDLNGWVSRFNFNPTPESIIATSGKITSALIWLNVKPTGAQPNPVYCQLYYDKTTGKWLPYSLGQCTDHSYYLF